MPGEVGTCILTPAGIDSESTEHVVKIGVDCAEPHMEFHVLSHFKNLEVVAVFPTEVVERAYKSGTGPNVGYDPSSANPKHPYDNTFRSDEALTGYVSTRDVSHPGPKKITEEHKNRSCQTTTIPIPSVVV